MLRGPGLRVGDDVTAFHESKQITEDRGQVVLLTHQKQVQCSHRNEWQGSVATKSLVCSGLWEWQGVQCL